MSTLPTGARRWWASRTGTAPASIRQPTACCPGRATSIRPLMLPAVCPVTSRTSPTRLSYPTASAAARAMPGQTAVRVCWKPSGRIKPSPANMAPTGVRTKARTACSPGQKRKAWTGAPSTPCRRSLVWRCTRTVMPDTTLATVMLWSGRASAGAA